MTHETQREWFYRLDQGNPQGPVSWAKLNQLAQSAVLKPTDLVASSDNKTFQPARHIANLRFPPSEPSNPYATGAQDDSAAETRDFRISTANLPDRLQAMLRAAKRTLFALYLVTILFAVCTLIFLFHFYVEHFQSPDRFQFTNRFHDDLFAIGIFSVITVLLFFYARRVQQYIRAPGPESLAQCWNQELVHWVILALPLLFLVAGGISRILEALR